MAKTNVLNIGPSQRYWAHSSANRSWQRFWGSYERHPDCGLYIECGANPSLVARLVNAFQQLPEELQEICLEWRVTFSFADGFTAAGNSSTFYADFGQSNRSLVSPHIELGSRSCQPSMILPHLAHELSHLYWRTRSSFEQEQYRLFLKETCQANCVEVTKYVQDLFADRKQTWGFKPWTEESFCDTVAVLVAPSYPSYDSASTVDLTMRRDAIAAFTGLKLPAPAPDHR